eukprot:3949868-Amphidinium_carterae.1
MQQPATGQRSSSNAQQTHTRHLLARLRPLLWSARVGKQSSNIANGSSTSLGNRKRKDERTEKSSLLVRQQYG